VNDTRLKEPGACGFGPGFLSLKAMRAATTNVTKNIATVAAKKPAR
jgi:hypothetical protein